MYTEADTARNRKLRNRELLTMALCALPGLIAGVAGAIIRNQILCAAGFIVCLGVIIFLGDLRVMPVLRYGRFLKEIQGGLSHKTAGALVRVGDDPVYTDGVWFHELILNIYEDLSEEGERRFLLDCAKQVPPELMNQDVVLTSHGNYVLDVAPLGGAHAAQA